MMMCLSKSMLPKRRFWNVEKHVGKTFCKHFRGTFSPHRVVGSMKSAYKMSYPHVFRRYKIFVWGEGSIVVRTTFQWFVAKSSTHTLENDLENTHFICCNSFQNLRLGAIGFFLSYGTKDEIQIF